MATGRKITVEFIGQDRSLGKTASTVESKFGALGSKMQKAGQIAGKVLLGGVVAGGAALVKMGQAAADDEAAQVKLATALRQAAGASDEQIASTEAWITAQGKALGIADDELRPALGRLADATGSVSEAQKLTALAMDVSAGTGKDLNSVIEALVKAQNGSVGGLGRLGVATKDAEGKTKSLKAITGDLATLYEGRAAKAADTTAGKQKRFKVALGELGEEIGAKVLPAMLKLSEIGLKMVDWVSRNQTTVAILVGTLAGFTAAVWAVGAAISAWTAITKVWSAVTKVAAGVQWALNAAMMANPIGLVVIALAALVAALVIAYKKSETFRKIVDGAFTKVKNAAVGAFNWVKRNWPLLLAILTGPFGLAVLGIAKHWDKIVDGVRAIPGKIKDLGKFFKEAGKHVIGMMVDGLKNAAGVISGIAGNVWNAVKGLLNDGIDKINAALEFEISLPGPNINVNPPNIPHLAKGGIVRKPTLALIGEDGPEAVVPLGRKNAPRGGFGMGGGVVVQINGPVYGDPRAFARFMVEELRKEKRLRGTALGIS